MSEQNKFLTHEAMDRTWVASSYIQIVSTHEFFDTHPELKERIENARAELFDVYQEIGKISVQDKV